MSRPIPSSESLLEEALKKFGDNTDINTLHEKTYELMIYYKSNYYERKVDEFLAKVDLLDQDKAKVKNKLLKPIRIEEKGKIYDYSNMMEEASRRVSQSFQPISGTLAELCVERELEKVGLKKDIHFRRREARTDIMVYHPNVSSNLSKHRVEVKNVSLRERAVRGLSFDGDTMIGFFNQPREFTEETVKIIDDHCKKTGGYCYVPQKTLEQMKYQGERFRLNTAFGDDMYFFVSKGKLP